MIPTAKYWAARAVYVWWSVVSAAADLVSAALDSTPTWARATAEEGPGGGTAGRARSAMSRLERLSDASQRTGAPADTSDGA